MLKNPTASPTIKSTFSKSYDFFQKKHFLHTKSTSFNKLSYLYSKSVSQRRSISIEEVGIFGGGRFRCIISRDICWQEVAFVGGSHYFSERGNFYCIFGFCNRVALTGPEGLRFRPLCVCFCLILLKIVKPMTVICLIHVRQAKLETLYNIHPFIRSFISSKISNRIRMQQAGQ